MRGARRNNDPLARVNFALSAVHTHPQRAGHNLEALLLLGVKVLGGDKPSTVYDKAHPKHVALARQECDVLARLGVVDRARHRRHSLRRLTAIPKRAPLDQEGAVSASYSRSLPLSHAKEHSAARPPECRCQRQEQQDSDL